MEFKNYFFGLSVIDRQSFAKKANSSVGHLTNCAYGYSPFNAKLCLSIERQTGGLVKRSQLRPDDAHLIWPDVKAPAKRKAAGVAA